MEEKRVFSVQERTNVGMALYNDVNKGEFKYARDILAGHGDVELRMAMYWSIHGKCVDTTDELAAAALLFTLPFDIILDDLKVKCRAHCARGLLDTMSGEEIENLARHMFSTVDRRTEEPMFRRHEREQREKKKEEAKTRTAFNSQHKPAPEGTVKELAAKYNRSIGEIRKLKAAGELHTLVQENG